VVISTSAPTATLPLAFVSLPAMLSKAWREKNPNAADKLLGTGSTQLTSWETGRQITVVKNPDFWGPAIDWDQVTFTASTDQGTRGNAARVGEADIIFRIAGRDVASINSAGKMRVVVSKSSRCAHIRITDTYGPLENKLVRQAMNYAVNVPEIVKSVFLGYAIPTGAQMQGDFSTGYSDTIKPYPHDPDMAKSLLSKAGYPKGFSVAMGTSQGRYPNDFEFSQAIAGQLAQVGIEVDLKIRESGEYAAMVSGQKQADPLIFWSSGNIIPTGQNAFNDLLRANPGVSFHMTSPELNALLDKLISEFDPTQRKNLEIQGGEIIRDHCPAIFGYEYQDLTAQTPRVDWKPPIFGDKLALAVAKRVG
jgi:peptide/nickel transport system substrate-binding protein